jgi:YD repeat-containing protein
MTATGTWTFLTGVFNANSGAVQLYVNGTASASASDSSPIPARGPLEIGAEKWDGQAGTGNFDGTIAGVQVYPAALSAAQVSSLYGQGRTGGDITTNALTTTWTRDQRGLPTSVTNPDGDVTSYAYDEAGQLAVTTGPPVTAQVYGSPVVTARPVTTAGYDTFGDTAEDQDPDGNVTTYGYDHCNRKLVKFSVALAVLWLVRWLVLLSGRLLLVVIVGQAGVLRARLGPGWRVVPAGLRCVRGGCAPRGVRVLPAPGVPT